MKRCEQHNNPTYSVAVDQSLGDSNSAQLKQLKWQTKRRVRCDHDQHFSLHLARHFYCHGNNKNWTFALAARAHSAADNFFIVQVSFPSLESLIRFQVCLGTPFEVGKLATGGCSVPSCVLSVRRRWLLQFTCSSGSLRSTCGRVSLVRARFCLLQGQCDVEGRRKRIWTTAAAIRWNIISKFQSSGSILAGVVMGLGKCYRRMAVVYMCRH